MKKKLSKKIITYSILIFVSYIFITIGLVSLIKENQEIKPYKQTVGKLLVKYDCLENKCGASYSYKIDGKEYYVLNEKNSLYFSNKEIVYYNPNKPEQSKIKSFDNILYIMIGTTILFVLCLIYIYKNKIKKLSLTKLNK